MNKERLVELSGITKADIENHTPTKHIVVEAKKPTKAEFKQLDVAAQKVWAAIGDAKKSALISLINSFQFKGTTEQHLAKVEAMANNPTKMDKFAADLMQVGHGNKVV